MATRALTVVQMVAIGCLLYSPSKNPDPWLWMGHEVFVIGDWMLAAAALLTLWSGFEYLRAAWPALKAEEGRLWRPEDGA